MAPTTTIDHDYSPDSKSDGGEGAGSKEVATVVVEGVEVDIDVQEEEAVLRRIDRFILPVMCVTFWLQYIDKSALAYASVFGLSKDLGLKGSQYSTLGSLFYIGYLVAEYPSSYLLQKLPINRYVPTMVVLWGMVLAVTSHGRNFTDFALCRTFLGVCEAVITPAFLMITGAYWKREEQPFRAGVWYSMNGLGSLCGSLITYGVGQIKYKDYYAWSWIFLFSGCLTVLWGLILFFVMPISPSKAWFLTPRQREVAVGRIRNNMTSLAGKQFKWSQAKEVFNPFIDPQGLLLFLWVVANEVVNGSAIFIKLVTQSYGFGTLNTILLGVPTGVMQMIFILSGTYLARKLKGGRIYTQMAYLCPSALGIILQIALPRSQKGALLFGNYLIGSYVASLVIGFSLPTVNSAGYTKRLTLTGTVFLGYCVGNIIGPQAFFTGEVPLYKTGFSVCLAMLCAQCLLLGILRVYYVRENKRRDRLMAEMEARGEEMPVYDTYADVTDIENLRFRYLL
ncbi:major facilitator superfamily domain-containing protein [Mrakia frigida]|uniref:major facilitator superfamily domain-containing protein n=1 Tax=Mrakia frigida TaxID=29902 RepID=UPI003FCBF79B